MKNSLWLNPTGRLFINVELGGLNVNVRRIVHG